MPEEPKEQKWWQSLAGVLTAAGAVLTAVTGLIVALRHEEPPAPPPSIATVTPQPTPAVTPQPTPAITPQPTPAVSPQPAPAVAQQAPPTPNIAGVWRDNWGTVYQLTQHGNAFQFAAVGTSCTGAYVQSFGSGSVAGNSVQISYQSSLPSRGSCSGTLSSNGQELTSTCTDFVCGTFVSSAVRE